MLHPDLRTHLQPLFDIMPENSAMSALVVTAGENAAAIHAVESLIAAPPFATNPALCAGLWLYIDELDRSHTISQEIKTNTGSFWHAIMHRREGDFANSHYWFDRAGRHPAMAVIEHYDPHRYVDDVQAAYTHPPEELIQRQRNEWTALMSWCFENP